MPFNSSRQINQNWVRNGLIGAWCPSLTGPTGTSLLDLSGFGNFGTLTGMDAAADWVDGGQGLALDFDGVDDYVISPITSRTWNANVAVTASAWVFLRSHSGCLFSLNSGSNVWQWSINTGAPINILTGKTGQIPTNGFFLGRSANVIAGSTTVAQLNSWTHVAYSWDGSQLNLFINGDYINTCSSNGGPNTGNISSVQIGRNGNSGTGYTNQMVSSLALWNRGLNAQEIISLYTGGPGYGLFGYGDIAR